MLDVQKLFVGEVKVNWLYFFKVRGFYIASIINWLRNFTVHANQIQYYYISKPLHQIEYKGETRETYGTSIRQIKNICQICLKIIFKLLNPYGSIPGNCFSFPSDQWNYSLLKKKQFACLDCKKDWTLTLEINIFGIVNILWKNTISICLKQDGWYFEAFQINSWPPRQTVRP